MTAPLHSRAPDHEYACEPPERPYHDDLRYDWRCRACWLHAKATVLAGNDPMHVVYAHVDGSLGEARLSEWVAAMAPDMEAIAP